MSEASSAPSSTTEAGFPWRCLVFAAAWTGSAVLSRAIGMWSAVGSAAVLLGLLVLGLEARDNRARLRVGWLELGSGVASGGLMIAATYVLYPVVGHLVPAVIPQAVSLYSTFGSATGPASILFLALVVFGEELVWRGTVQDSLVARLGPGRGVLVTTALYGLAVVPVGLPLLVAIALGCGLYWGILRVVTGSLTAPLIAHLLWNLVVLVLWPIAGTSG